MRNVAHDRENDDSGAVMIIVTMMAMFFFVAVLSIAAYAMYSVKEADTVQSASGASITAEGLKEYGIRIVSGDLKKYDYCNRLSPMTIESDDFSGRVDGTISYSWGTYDHGYIPQSLEFTGTEFESGCPTQDEIEAAENNDKDVYVLISVDILYRDEISHELLSLHEVAGSGSIYQDPTLRMEL